VKDEKPDGHTLREQPSVGEDTDDDAGVETVDAEDSGDKLSGEPVGTSGAGDATNGGGGGLTVQPAVEVTDDPVGVSGEGNVPDTGAGDKTTQKAPSSRRRRAAFAVLRALAVLVVAAITYQLVVPTVHVVRTRLSRLVPTKTGVAAFDKTRPQAGEQDDTQTGIAALTTAAKRSPKQTGLYSIEWSPSDRSGAGIIAFLLPNESDASTALSQIRAQQLGANSYSSNSLTRASTYAVPGVPGSYAAIYRPPAKDAGSPSLAVTAFRYGRVVAVSEAASQGATAQPAANTITTGEYGNLRRLGAGFSLSVTRYPVVATTLWIVGAVVLAALAALGPIAWRRRAQRRQRANEEEMAHRVVVGKQVIVKHRR
jgi:hypothetical protein